MFENREKLREASRTIHKPIEAMWEKRGPELGLDQSTFYRMARDAEHKYADLPFHNFTHAVSDVLDKAIELANMCEENGTPVNRRVLTYATVRHDTDYHKSQDQRGFTEKGEPISREMYSAVNAVHDAPKYGLSMEESMGAYTAIRSTQYDGPQPVSVEDKILVRADIHNVSGNFQDSFIHNTKLLREEAKIIANLNDEKFNEVHFLRTSIVVLASFINKDLLLGEFDKGWSRHAIFNLNRLIRYAAEQESTQATQYVGNLGSMAVRKVFDMSPFSKKEEPKDPNIS